LSHGEQARQVRRVQRTTPYLPRRTRREIARGMLRRRREIARSVWRQRHAVSDYSVLLVVAVVSLYVWGPVAWRILAWLLALATGHAHL